MTTFLQQHWLEISIAILVVIGALGPVARRLGYPRVAKGMEAVGFALFALINAFRPGALPPALDPSDGAEGAGPK